ncbi:MAG: ABC transporter ATP-binding protein [Candidatus Geothermarchaeales archaeon]
MSDILVIDSVVKSFGGLVALDEVDMNIKGEIINLLIGPNGSGKTTLINVITGFYKPDRGRVSFDGEDITGWPPHKTYEKGIVRTFQIPQPFLKLTVLENLLTSYRHNPGEGFLRAPLRKTWIREEEEALDKAFELLELLSLDHMWDQEAYKLSGGQMKLLEAGRALMSGAKMIFMDEPAAGINPVLAHEMFSHLRDLKNKLNVTFLFVEHRLELALQFVDHVYAMSRGKIVSEGTADEVFNDPVVVESYMGG